MENQTTARPKSRMGKRLGYVIAIVINIAMLVIANNILAWDILPFLTQDLTRVLPLLNASLAATIVANLAFLFFDPDWFTALCRLVLNIVAVVVAALFLAVFPFDFSAYVGFNWEMLVRIVMTIGIIGASIGVIVETVKLFRALGRQG